MSKLFFFAATVAPAVGFCGGYTHLQARAEGEVPISTFGYSGDIGPFNWASLAVENVECSVGTRQSPINMIQGQFHAIASDGFVLTIPDFPEGLDFENLGTTIEAVTEGKGASMRLEGVEYELKQFHFHHPSEHLDNGTSLPLEMHMVFSTPDNQISVIGVYVDIDSSPAVANIPAPTVLGRRGRRGMRARIAEPKHEGLWKKQAETAQEFTLTPAVDTSAVSSAMLETLFQSVEAITVPGTKVTSQPLVMSELVETLKLGHFESYSGSLTTPPCSEGVHWMVATQKVKISTASFEAVRNVVKFNQRFQQGTLGGPNLLSINQAPAA